MQQEMKAKQQRKNRWNRKLWVALLVVGAVALLYGMVTLAMPKVAFVYVSSSGKYGAPAESCWWIDRMGNVYHNNSGKCYTIDDVEAQRNDPDCYYIKKISQFEVLYKYAIMKSIMLNPFDRDISPEGGCDIELQRDWYGVGSFMGKLYTFNLYGCESTIREHSDPRAERLAEWMNGVFRE